MHPFGFGVGGAHEELGPWLLRAKKCIDPRSERSTLRLLLCPPSRLQHLRSTLHVAMRCLERQPTLGHREAHFSQRAQTGTRHLRAHREEGCRQRVYWYEV